MGRFSLAILLSTAAALASACGSSTQSVTGPSTVKCAVNAAANPSSFNASGGSGAISVTTNRECQWSALAANDWIKLGSSSGQGDGTVSFTVARNGDPSARRGTIAVGDQQVGIAQEAALCVFTVSPARDSVSPGGGRKTVTVTASSPMCTWTARSDVDWLVIVDGTQGTGTGQVTYEARATTGPARVGTLLVAGKVVTVAQGEGCNISIAPTTQTIGAGGGSGSVAVNTAAGCPWVTQSDVPWITITAGQSGTGPGTVGFTVAASDGPARTGTLTVGGQVFTVSQASGCRFTIDPTSQSIGSAGGSASVNVHTAAGCGWSSTSNAPWLTIDAGAAGTGEGRVQLTVASSVGPARTGTLTIAGRTFTVNQASGCTYSLTPTSQDVGDAGGDFSFAVSSAGGCTWRAASNANWVTIASGASGSGNGRVSFHVASNAMGGAQRSTTISVNTQTFTVNQSAGVACAYTLAPTSMDVAAGAGSASFSVQTVLTCPWTARSDVPWITITSYPSGAGNGTVRFSYSENPAGSPARSGTISVNGQTFTLNQAAAACTYALNPASKDVSFQAGTGSFSVATQAGCSWTAVSDSPTWLTVSSTTADTVNYAYTENPAGSPPRSGKITVNGQTFTLNQGARD